MTYSERRRLSVPASTKGDANAIAHVIDPDVGGHLTFFENASIDGNAPATHCVASLPLTPQTAALIDSKDPAAWFSTLSVVASQRGRTPVTLEQCQAVAGVIGIDDEITVIDVIDG